MSVQPYGLYFSLRFGDSLTTMDAFLDMITVTGTAGSRKLLCMYIMTQAVACRPERNGELHGFFARYPDT